MLERKNYYILNSVTKEIFCPDTLKFYKVMKIVPETKPYLQELLSNEEMFPDKLLKCCKLIKIKR